MTINRDGWRSFTSRSAVPSGRNRQRTSRVFLCGVRPLWQGDMLFLSTCRGVLHSLLLRSVGRRGDRGDSRSSTGSGGTVGMTCKPKPLSKEQRRVLKFITDQERPVGGIQLHDFKAMQATIDSLLARGLIVRDENGRYCEPEGM
jgi:hypothetical protein